MALSPIVGHHLRNQLGIVRMLAEAFLAEADQWDKETRADLKDLLNAVDEITTTLERHGVLIPKSEKS